MACRGAKPFYVIHNSPKTGGLKGAKPADPRCWDSTTERQVECAGAAPLTDQRWRIHDWRGDWLLVHGESESGFLFGEILLFAAYVAYGVIQAARWPGID
jgi:hypothetical protein